LQSEQGKIM